MTIPFCISGSNGDGKTTLSKILMGILEPSAGEGLIDGTNLNKLSLKWWKKQVAYIPQTPNILNSSFLWLSKITVFKFCSSRSFFF